MVPLTVTEAGAMTSYWTVSVDSLPALSRATTVKSWSPRVDVSTAAPLETVPSQDSIPEPESWHR